MENQRSELTTDLPPQELPPKRDGDDETSWADPWEATREDRERLGPERLGLTRPEFLTDLSMASRITDEISRDPHLAAKLAKARRDAQEGRRLPRPIDTASK